LSIFTGLNGYHFKKFMESFLAAAGYNYGATIAHCQTAAFTTKIAHYFIKVDKTGMVHPDKKAKSCSCTSISFKLRQAVILLLFFKKKMRIVLSVSHRVTWLVGINSILPR
jgi:hypothetical protein